MIVTAPTKQQMIDDELATGFKNIRMLRLTNISANLLENTLILKKYFVIHCLIGQEVFITPTIMFLDDLEICRIDDNVFTGADDKKYTSFILREMPYWCEYSSFALKN